MTLGVFFPVHVLAITAFLIVPTAGQVPHAKFAAPVTYNTGPSADSVAIADLRGNGHLDLVVANYCETVNQNGNCTSDGEGGVSVLLGNGDGTFQSAAIYGTGACFADSIAVGDLNGDGIPDLAIADSCGNVNCEPAIGAVSVMLGNGDGTFQPAVVYSSGDYYSYSVALGDLRGDGKLDIVLTSMDWEGNDFDGSVSVLLGNGDGTFQPAVSYNSGAQDAASVAIGDLNGDGIPDLVVANYGEPLVGVLLGNGDGTFQPAVTYGGGDANLSSVVLGDLRGNGILDVIAKNGYIPVKRPHSALGVLLGNGDGTLQTVVSYLADGVALPSSPGVGSGVNSLVIADVNGDGILDAVSVEPCQSLKHYTDCVGNEDVSVLLGNGDGTLQSPVAYSSNGFLAWGIAVADVNGDGRPDLVVANYQVAPYVTNGTVAVFLNETSYASKTTLTSSPNPSQVNQTVTFTATITPAPPNGELATFYNAKTELGTGATTNGVATLTTSFSAAKTYTIKSTYPGDPFRKPSSATVKQVVNP